MSMPDDRWKAHRLVPGFPRRYPAELTMVVMVVMVVVLLVWWV
jgi:hypothetical protein